MASLLYENKTIFFIILTGILLLELEIFALAVMKSGDRTYLKVRDARGRVILKSEGEQLLAAERRYLLETFGSLNGMDIRLVTEKTPFPFRAWFAAAAGLPVGVMLVFAFLVRAYGALTDRASPARKARAEPVDVPEAGPLSRFERTMAMLGRLNIFAVGTIALIVILAYWIVPNAMMAAGRMTIRLVQEYRWFFLGAGGILLAVFCWIIYLRYLLARKDMESRCEMERLRLELAYRHGDPQRLLTAGIATGVDDETMLPDTPRTLEKRPPGQTG
jgi:hypothetical protein